MEATNNPRPLTVLLAHWSRFSSRYGMIPHQELGLSSGRSILRSWQSGQKWPARLGWFGRAATVRRPSAGRDAEDPHSVTNERGRPRLLAIFLGGNHRPGRRLCGSNRRLAWRQGRDGVRPMYRARAAALPEYCSRVRCIAPYWQRLRQAPSARTMSSAATKSRSLRQGRECHGLRVAGQACDRDWW